MATAILASQVNDSTRCGDFILIGDHTLIRTGLTGSSPVVIDAGANEGDFSRGILEQWPDAEIHAVEPTPGLQGHLNSLRLASVSPVALASRSGKVTFHLNENSTASSIVGAGSGHKASISVPCVTLDQIMDGIDAPSIDIVKLDIEGAEIDVLQNVKESNLRRIRQLTVEYHDFLYPEQGKHIAKIHRRLESAGMRRFNFSWPGNFNVLYFRQEHFTVARSSMMQMRMKLAYWKLRIGRKPWAA